MPSQNEIKRSIPLLTPEGTLTEEGWARRPYYMYDRNSIPVSNWKIKEWDYYSILSHDGLYGITFTMSDLGYAGLFAICFLDFKEKIFQQVDTLSILPMGKTGFPSTDDLGSISFSDKKLSIQYEYTKGKRVIRFSSPLLQDGKGNKGLSGEIVLQQSPELESMTIATSWKENRKAFYHNTKINCMPAEGSFKIGEREFRFSKDKDFGALDWGRGVWTYKNRWYWSSASGYLNGEPLGLNLGYGFTDRSPASENIILYKNKIHKLDQVEFHIDTNNYMNPWKFTSNDNRLELDFQPLVDRNSSLNLSIIKSIQHQVFGYFTGNVVLDEGKVLHLDKFLGFAEDVLNHY
jgi:hypothetical protein